MYYLALLLCVVLSGVVAQTCPSPVTSVTSASQFAGFDLTTGGSYSFNAALTYTVPFNVVVGPSISLCLEVGSRVGEAGEQQQPPQSPP